LQLWLGQCQLCGGLADGERAYEEGSGDADALGGFSAGFGAEPGEDGGRDGLNLRPDPLRWTGERNRLHGQEDEVGVMHCISGGLDGRAGLDSAILE
jgi:hypothetical protein